MTSSKNFGFFKDVKRKLVIAKTLSEQGKKSFNLSPEQGKKSLDLSPEQRFPTSTNGNFDKTTPEEFIGIIGFLALKTAASLANDIKSSP
jgi:hypothetical protein